MGKTAPISGGRLKSFVERIEKLMEERSALNGDIRDVFSEAKGVGYDTKTMRKLITIRGMDAADRAEAETLLDTYAHALGMETSANLVEPTEEELIDRASKIVREVDQCMGLVSNGKLPKIAAIQQLIGCSTGKAHKLRGFVAERFSRSNEMTVKTKSENPLHDPDTGELPVEMAAEDLWADGISKSWQPRGETFQAAAGGRSEPNEPAAQAVNADLSPGRVAPESVDGQGSEVGNIPDRPAVAIDAGLFQRVHAGLKARGDLPPDATLTIVEINPGEGAVDAAKPDTDQAAAPPEEPPHELVREIDPEAMAEAIIASDAAEKPNLFQRLTGSFQRGPENVVAIDPKPAPKPSADDDDLQIPAFLRRAAPS